jgi:uncharacterized membrane protein
MKILLTLAAILGAALPALAHPGHSLTDASASHLLTSPFHVLTLAAMGVVTYAAARLVQKQAPRLALQATGTMLMVTAVVLWGLRA